MREILEIKRENLRNFRIIFNLFKANLASKRRKKASENYELKLRLLGLNFIFNALRLNP